MSHTYLDIYLSYSWIVLRSDFDIEGGKLNLKTKMYLQKENGIVWFTALLFSYIFWVYGNLYYLFYLSSVVS